MKQLERAKRYLKRIEQIYAGVFCSKDYDKDAYEDDVVSFFIHCYHVRDWIVHLNRLGINARDVDAYINSHKALKICADLANGSKHCKITRTLRTGRQPHFGATGRRESTWISGGGGGEVVKSSYTILSGTEFIDALVLAKECIELWDEYVRAIDEHKRSG